MEENLPESKPKEKRSRKAKIEPTQKWDIRSKKFLAFVVTVNVGTFIFFYLLNKGKVDYDRLYENYFEFILWNVGIYVGGNSTEKIASRFSNRR